MPVKNLDQKIRQALRILDGYDRQQSRRLSKSRWSSAEESANNYDNLSEEVWKLTGAKNKWEYTPDVDSWWKKCAGQFDGDPICDDKFYGIGGREPQILKFIPTKSEDVELDPLMYVDHPSRIIRDYARKLINGEQ